MRLRDVALTLGLPALVLSALPDLLPSCQEGPDIVNLLQTRKTGSDKAFSANESAKLPVSHSSGADDRTDDRLAQVEFSSLNDNVTNKLLPSKSNTKTALFQLIGKALSKLPGDYSSTSVYGPLIAVGIIGFLVVLCAIAATTQLIRSPGIVQNPMSVDELQTKRQQLFAMIKAYVPQKPWCPAQSVPEGPENRWNQAHSLRDQTHGQMQDHVHGYMQGHVHSQTQGQGHQSPQAHPERDVIVHHPLDGGRLGINLTNDNLLITGITDPEAERFGFVVGERVTHINGVPVENRADFKDALKAAIHNNKLAGYPLIVRVMGQAPSATEPASLPYQQSTFLPVYEAMQPVPHQDHGNSIDAASFPLPEALSQVPTQSENQFQTVLAPPRSKAHGALQIPLASVIPPPLATGPVSLPSEEPVFQQIPIYQAAPFVSASAIAPPMAADLGIAQQYEAAPFVSAPPVVSDLGMAQQIPVYSSNTATSIHAQLGEADPEQLHQASMTYGFATSPATSIHAQLAAPPGAPGAEQLHSSMASAFATSPAAASLPEQATESYTMATAPSIAANVQQQSCNGAFDVERVAMDLFDRLDKNHDGSVSRTEFERCLQDVQAAMARPV